MFKQCQPFGESLEFLKEIGDRPESQVKKWGLSRGSRVDSGGGVSRYGKLVLCVGTVSLYCVAVR